MLMRDNYLKPNWPAPKNVRAYTTTRQHGYSKAPYNSFNLAQHCGDDCEAVLQNRAKLRGDLGLMQEPIWLTQTHSARVVSLDAVAKNFSEIDLNADASFTTKKEIICAVMTADCLPVLLTDDKGSFVSAIHAGWQGLAAGVIEATLKELPVAGENIMAWLGPAIGPQNFMVGSEVRDAFLRSGGKDEESAFAPWGKCKWLCDMYAIARRRLWLCGVRQIYGGDFCSYSDEKKFYSYRRDGGVTGRMASLIWLV